MSNRNQGIVLLVDLMELPLGEFDLIMGYLSNVVSDMVAEKLVRKRCESYLTYVLDRNVDSSALKTFPMCFPKNYPEYLLIVKWNLKLNLYITPCRMTPKIVAQTKNPTLGTFGSGVY